MGVVVSFVDYQPSARYDLIAWTQAKIEESLTSTGTFTLVDTIALSPVDADPANPALRSFTTENGTAVSLWYRVVFVDADGDLSAPTTPIQNIASAGTPYVTVAELARILKIRAPSAEQTAAMERVLTTAAGEIDSEIDLEAGDELSGWERSLAAEVNLERAVEHWRQQESPFGLIGLGPEMPAERTARDSWERHAFKLAPLKSQWGIA